jgi:hypothetical protein
MNEMKTGNYLRILFAVLLISVIGGCTEYPAYELTNQMHVNKSSLNMYVGNEVQITASPVGENFVWSSDNESVASVSQTGLVKAISEGLASITVKYGEVEVKIDVRVRIFIPLTDINLSITSLMLYVGDETQIWAYSVPEDASEATFTWRSANPVITTVDKNGMVKGVSKGITNIIVGSGDIEKSINVKVAELYKCDKTGWTVEVSDQHSEGGGKNMIIDGDYAANKYWHSQYGPNVACPHWAVIDMKEPVEVGRVVTVRRNNGDTKTVQYFVGDSPEANADTWVKIIEGAYASKTANHTLTLNATQFVTGRYLKFVMPDSYRDPFTGICEIDVYGLMY